MGEEKDGVGYTNSKEREREGKNTQIFSLKKKKKKKKKKRIPRAESTVVSDLMKEIRIWFLISRTESEFCL